MPNTFNKGSKLLFAHGAGIGLATSTLASSAAGGTAVTHCLISSAVLAAGSEFLLKQNKQHFRIAPVITGLFLSAALSSVAIGHGRQMEDAIGEWLESPAMRGSIIVAPPQQTYRIK